MPPKKIDFNTAAPKQLRRMNEIIRVSAELFSTKGYLETSVDDIAAAAQFTKGAVYYYFENKTEILYYICSSYVDLDLENLEKSFEKLENVAEKIKYIVFHHINHYATHSQAARTLLHEAYNLPPKYLKRVRDRERRYYNIVTSVILEFVGNKARKEMVTALAFTLFGMMNWIYSWYNPKALISPEELSRLVFDIFTNGIIHSDIT